MGMHETAAGRRRARGKACRDESLCILWSKGLRRTGTSSGSQRGSTMANIMQVETNVAGSALTDMGAMVEHCCGEDEIKMVRVEKVRILNFRKMSYT